MDHLQAVNTMACERYLLDEMTQLERHAFEEHFFDCPDCAEDVRLSAVMRDGARAGFAKPGFGPVLNFNKGWGWRRSVALPWAAAAMLALVVGYRGYQDYQGSQGSQGSRSLSSRSGEGSGVVPAAAVALVPVTLRPAQRGEEPVVQIGPGGTVTLAVDLGDARFEGTIRYQLRRADGTAVSNGDLTAPQPGTPLLLLIPASTLKASAHYVLRLQNPRIPTLTSADYRFTVGAP